MPVHCNELDGKTWLKYSISIWSDLTKSVEEKALKHPASFPLSLASRLIRLYSLGPNTVVCDPFAGIGTTLLAARSLGRSAIGTELSSDFVELATQRLMQQELFSSHVQEEPTIILYHADARTLAQHVLPESVDLVVTSPPYWDILNRKRVVDHKEIRTYSQSSEDIGNIEDYQTFLTNLRQVFQKVYAVLRPKSYCCINVMDLRKKQQFYPLHMDVSLFMRDIGFTLNDIFIWDRRQDYNSVGPIGYPTVFLVNKVHEYILIFQKPA